MKYPSLKKPQNEVKSLKAPRDGICPKEFAEKCRLEFAKNITLKNGKLVSRKGFVANRGSLLDVSIADESLYYNFELTDTVVNIHNQDYRIAYSLIKYTLTYYYLFVFAVAENRLTLSLGQLIFPSSVDTFYYPEKMHFYSGKSQIGNGIFALIALRDKKNYSNTKSVIYELGTSNKTWLRCDNFYIPTVYINGRGNEYRSLDWNFADAPKKPQSLNMLSGKFYAYYSSDGYSSNFSLPYTNIDNKMVVCRLYYGENEFTQWSIAADATTSTQELSNAMVTANLDRERGLIYFTAFDNNPYAIPAIGVYSQNNIRIMAEKSVEKDFFNIADSSSMTVFSGKRIFSGGQKQNKLYYTDYDNPLYFPEILDNTVGMSDTPITKLAVSGERIVALKENGIYDIKLKNDSSYYEPELLSQGEAVLKEASLFSVSTISDRMGCRNAGSVATNERGIIWQGLNGKIYLLSRSGNSIKSIGENARELISDFPKIGEFKSIGVEESYYLCYNNKILIIDGDNSCYYWEIPTKAEIIGFIETDGRISALYRYDNNEYCYLAELSGDEDVFISGIDAAVEHRFPIESEIALSLPLGDAGTETTVSCVDLNLEREGKCEISVGSQNLKCRFVSEASRFHDKCKNRLKLITDLTALNPIKLRIKSNKGITFGGADIYYTKH